MSDNNEIHDIILEQLINAIDYENEITNDLAVKLASNSPGEYNIQQICHIFEYVFRSWKYVNDTNKNYKRDNFRSASRSINNNFCGDCDDFAILISALIESIGGRTRISTAYNDDGGHAFTEVYLTDNSDQIHTLINEIITFYNSNFTIYYTIDNGSYWLNLDWQGDPVHVGSDYFNFNNRTIYFPTIENPTYKHCGPLNFE
jgi:hypothetical protein